MVKLEDDKPSKKLKFKKNLGGKIRMQDFKIYV